MENKQIGAVIVAAGLSSRMGEFKPMMRIGNETMIRRVILTFQQEKIHPIILVTGHQSEQLVEHIKDLPVRVVFNPNYQYTQMFDSAKLGFDVLQQEYPFVTGVFFTPGDIPLFSNKTIQEMLAFMRENEKQILSHGGKISILKPKSNQVSGHPIYIGVHVLLQLSEYQGNGGLKQALSKIVTSEQFWVQVKEEGILLDADTKEDMQVIRNLAAAKRKEREIMQDSIIKLETNLDDCNGEALGFTMEHLLAEGALDVFYTPIFMKKLRPAYLLSVLCKEADVEKMEEILFLDTTTIGIRKTQMERTVLPRELKKMSTSLGIVQVKISTYKGQKKINPEYESIAKIAKETKMGYQMVYAKVMSEIASNERNR